MKTDILVLLLVLTLNPSQLCTAAPTKNPEIIYLDILFKDKDPAKRVSAAEKLGILKTINHPEFFPIHKGVLWNEDGTVTFDWGDSRKDINQIWVFVPSQNKFERIFEKGEIKSRLFP